MPQKIALVGHCGPDSYMLRSAVKFAVKDSEIAMITDDNALAALLSQGPALLLVNRQLDGNFDVYEGVDLIRRLHDTHPAVPTMLISNFPESQQAAKAAGARPGFGKREIGSAKMRDALSGALV